MILLRSRITLPRCLHGARGHSQLGCQAPCSSARRYAGQVYGSASSFLAHACRHRCLAAHKRAILTPFLSVSLHGHGYPR